MQCTVGEQALRTQPLPFACPMDHVLPVSNWHGTYERRKARGERCALARRADGPPLEGMPYRTQGWLGGLAQRPELAASSASLVSACEVPPPPPPAPSPSPRTTRLPPEPRALATSIKHGSAPQHGPHLDQGPTIVLPVGGSAQEVRAAAERGKELRLLHVSLEAAVALRPCLPPSEARDTQALLDLLFRFRWCWRPEEMVEPRNLSDGTTLDVCVWGFEPVKGPPSCDKRGREPPPCGAGSGSVPGVAGPPVGR